ncbi:response regulator [Roseomonas sp. USHLN139]|uniref:response regulator n=1 Tax=Roseomonas sp. USHLN139 TaxID=3081298 RepID=UPI003B0262EC
MTLPGHPARVLILEDSALDAELISEALDRGGMAHVAERVWTRADFEALLAAQPFDIVLADYKLPEFDGLSALDLVMARRPELPVIIVSATLGEERAVEVMKRGATDFVMKERLPGAVKRAFGEAAERRGRHQAEARLRELNARLEGMVETRTRERDLVWTISHDLLLICGADGVCQHANPAWREALGHDPEALPGQRLDAFLHPEDVAPAHQHLGAIARGQVVRDFAARLRHREGGYRLYLWTWVPTAEGLFHATGRDLTERELLEQRLRQVQKMESIGQITGGVAHDFNNLLTVIIGALDTLQRRQDGARPQEERELLDGALRSAERAAGLTRSLLAYSRRQPLEFRPVDVGELVLGLSDLLQRTLGEGIAISVDCAPKACLALTDRNQLESAVLNLAVNARDAMAAGGSLAIRTREVTLDEAALDAAGGREAGDLAPGRFIEISVSDSGSGMDEATLSRAFEPFFTTKGEGHGTGLGLSQVYGFCRQSRGHVRISSRPGAGTSVVLLLPRAEAEPARHRDDDTAPEDFVSRNGELVLVVEDNPDVRRYALGLLAELGYRTLQAGDGPEALRVLEQEPGIELLFTDLGLPNGMNGRQLAEEALRRRPDLKVVYATAYATDAVLRDGVLEPGVELLNKPYTFAVLGRRLRAVLGGGVKAAARTPRILVVEDDPLVRMVSAMGLSAAGYEVVEAGSARSARTAFREAAQPIDAVIVDIGLPDEKGDVLAREWRNQDARLPIIVASGYVSDVVQARLAQDARLRFVAKPYTQQHLMTVLSELGLPVG